MTGFMARAPSKNEHKPPRESLGCKIAFPWQLIKRVPSTDGGRKISPPGDKNGDFEGLTGIPGGGRSRRVADWSFLSPSWEISLPPTSFISTVYCSRRLGIVLAACEPIRDSVRDPMR